MKSMAALYLRSSKDRSDASPAAQRRELQALASTRGLTIADEFCDVVVSGKTEHRPGFQALLRALRAKDRTWSTILMVDTSRLARNQYVAHFFRHECKRRGVEVIFGKTPEMDGVAGILLPAILHAIDEVHSYMSREKGLAGMSENVRSGYRSGGSAPYGYQLRKVTTGAIRDGAPVTKSVLEPDPTTSGAVGVYLRERAAGVPRPRAIARSGIALRSNTLIGMEWNALQYAGHTVWNVHAERGEHGYVGGQKRRPRSEWVIGRDTHLGLITEEEAEQLLARLEAKALSRGSLNGGQRDRGSPALLGGLLFAPDGTKWWSERDRYRWQPPGGGSSRSVPRHAVEGPVLDQVLGDIASPAFADALLASTRAALASEVDQREVARVRADVAALGA